jgi:NAD(P)H-dependent FMN reductase
VKVLAVSGSLRAASINTALLNVATRFAPSDVEVTLYAGLGSLPLFNPDVEARLPPAAASFRSAVGAADALLIASPEYAHGVTGVMKNALDWLVGDERFGGKHVAILNASARAHHADSQLREILKTMSAVVVEEASLTVGVAGSHHTEDSLAATHAVVATLERALEALYAAVVLHRAGQGPSFTY